MPVLDIKWAYAEQGLFRCRRGEVGAEVAKACCCPQKMIDAIQHRATPFAGGVNQPIVGVVHRAGWRARGQELTLSGEELISSDPEPVSLALGIRPESVMGEAVPLATREVDVAV